MFAISLARLALRRNGLTCGFSLLKYKLVKKNKKLKQCIYLVAANIFILFVPGFYFVRRVSDSFFASLFSEFSSSAS